MIALAIAPKSFGLIAGDCDVEVIAAAAVMGAEASGCAVSVVGADTK
jgi:hypothetical protein